MTQSIALCFANNNFYDLCFSDQSEMRHIRSNKATLLISPIQQPHPIPHLSCIFALPCVRWGLLWPTSLERLISYRFEHMIRVFQARCYSLTGTFGCILHTCAQLRFQLEIEGQMKRVQAVARDPILSITSAGTVLQTEYR